MEGTSAVITPIKVPGTEELPSQQVEVHMFSKYYGVEIPSRWFLDHRYTVQTAALLMLARAKLGVCDSNNLTVDPFNSGYQYYRACRYYYEPYSLSMVFTREETPETFKHYHLSLCFVSQRAFTTYNPVAVSRFCKALFRHRAWSVMSHKGGNPERGQLVMHYVLRVSDWEEL